MRGIMKTTTHKQLLAQKANLQLTLDVANEIAAIECSRAIAELLQPLTSTKCISIGRGPASRGLASCGAARFTTFEVGFGSPAEHFTNPNLRVAVLKDLFSGDAVPNVPLLLPRAPSHTPLAASIAQSFPILLRGVIALSDLTTNRDALQTEAFSEKLLPYQEAHGRLRALNVQEIRLCDRSINKHSDFYESVQSQLDQRLSELRKLFLRSYPDEQGTEHFTSKTIA
jgi:hypothetical protein